MASNRKNHDSTSDEYVIKNFSLRLDPSFETKLQKAMEKISELEQKAKQKKSQNPK